MPKNSKTYVVDQPGVPRWAVLEMRIAELTNLVHELLLEVRELKQERNNEVERP